MRRDEFWSMVESSSAGHDPQSLDGEAVAAALVARLAKTSPETVLGFHEQFDQASGALDRWDVWAAAYLIGGGCSDDSFSDFRAGVIALGRDWYERILASPDALADHPLVHRAATQGDSHAVFAESMNYVASEAYDKVTGDDHTFYEAWEARQNNTVDPNQPDPTEMGDEFDFDDEDEMRRRLPRLAALFLAPSPD